MKKYRYYFIDEDLEIFADTGRECEDIYNATHTHPYEGTIELTNLETGYVNMMLPIKFK